MFNIFFLLCISHLVCSLTYGQLVEIDIPSLTPSTAVAFDPSLLSVSIEFFAFPGYTSLAGTVNCLENVEQLRQFPPAVRIGGTTQDRATYDSSLDTAVIYTVASPADAPDFLSFGPGFFELAKTMKGDVTLGLNRQLNNISNTGEAASQAANIMNNLLAIELGNEPEFYNSSSPIIVKGQSWSPTTDGASQKLWIEDLSPSLGSVIQAAVYLQYPTWSTSGLIPRLGDAISGVKTFSGHSYPQSACGGASTNLTSLMSHEEIVAYTRQYTSEAVSAHAQNKSYFLGETNSATCGGGGISPTFGAALWVMDYVLQAALTNVDRLYFHQGTISNCAYCFWGNGTVFAPYYGAVFVSDFLGGSSANTRLFMLDDGTGPLAVYAIYSITVASPIRILVYNSVLFDGTGERSNITVSFRSSKATDALPTVRLKRLSAPSAFSLEDVTIGGNYTFDGACRGTGLQIMENVPVEVMDASGDGALSINFDISVRASEAVILYL